MEENKKLVVEYCKKVLIFVLLIIVVFDYRLILVKVILLLFGYVKKMLEGYNLDFGLNGQMGILILVGNNLYVQQGVYFLNYYCLQLGIGGFVWGLEFGEFGLLLVVYYEGVLFINIYFCMLYVIDVVFGKLLWSKWLVGMIYFMFIVLDDDVFVVYNYGGKLVLVLFDFCFGKFCWMQDFDGEVFVCLIVVGNEVYVIL